MSSPDPRPRPALISSETLVPVGSVFAIVMGLLRVYNAYNAQLVRLDNIERELRDAKMAIAVNRWTCTEQERFILILRARNPQLDIPEVNKPCLP